MSSCFVNCKKNKLCQKINMDEGIYQNSGVFSDTLLQSSNSILILNNCGSFRIPTGKFQRTHQSNKHSSSKVVAQQAMVALHLVVPHCKMSANTAAQRMQFTRIDIASRCFALSA